MAPWNLSAIGGRGLDLQDSITAVSDLTAEIIAIHQSLARQHGVSIVAGVAPFVSDEGRSHNIAQVFGPKGAAPATPRSCRHRGSVTRGTSPVAANLKVFDIGIAKVGLVICYDIEFPLLARALAEAGAEIILAPSNTETEWGYWRVRTGAAARALENQVYTVHSRPASDQRHSVRPWSRTPAWPAFSRRPTRASRPMAWWHWAK